MDFDKLKLMLIESDEYWIGEGLLPATEEEKELMKQEFKQR